MCLKHGNTMKMRMAVMAPSSQPSQPQSPPLLLLLLTMTPDRELLFEGPVVGIPAAFGQSMDDTFIQYDISPVARHLAILTDLSDHSSKSIGFNPCPSPVLSTQSRRVE